MAIATTIITEMLVSASRVIALVFMTSELSCSALLQGIEYGKLEIIGMRLHTKLSPESFYYVGYLKFGAFHYLCCG
jgi:hypothetical protein